MNGTIYCYPQNEYETHYVGIDDKGNRVENIFLDWCGMELYIAQKVSEGRTKDVAYRMYWQEIFDYAEISIDINHLTEYLNDNIDKFDEDRQEWALSYYSVVKRD